MNPDIINRKDIDTIVNSFYEKVKHDECIGPFFLGSVFTNLEDHLSTMGDFWENILFHSGNYQGDPLAAHRHVHPISITTKLHFEQWLHLFNETIDERFSGANASLMKQRANGIASVILSKISR